MNSGFQLRSVKCSRYFISFRGYIRVTIEGVSGVKQVCSQYYVDKCRKRSATSRIDHGRGNRKNAQLIFCLQLLIGWEMPSLITRLASERRIGLFDPTLFLMHHGPPYSWCGDMG